MGEGRGCGNVKLPFVGLAISAVVQRAQAACDSGIEDYIPYSLIALNRTCFPGGIAEGLVRNTKP